MHANWFCLLVFSMTSVAASAQELSVRPGINDSFRDPNVDEFIGKFETESREVFARRKEIVAACKVKPGMTVADIGAGTGLFTRLFSTAVGDEGRVVAVDIAQKFVDHIRESTRTEGLRNIEALRCAPDSTNLPAGSVDLAFICDTYHHFEFPQKTMKSIRKALKPDGRVIVIDFRRVEGESTEWTMSHVRAGQEVFEAEIIAAGFVKKSQQKDLLKENYMVVFEKTKQDPTTTDREHEPMRGRRGPGAGRGLGPGPGRGPDASMRDDQDVFHFLLEKHKLIRRKVTQLDNGVETLTESDDPEVAAKIQEHVTAMHGRVKTGRGLRFWDDLFSAVFRNSKKIAMTVENTEHGVRVKETSDDAFAVQLVQAHAKVVSKFVERGFDEAQENHAVPTVTPAKSKTHE